MLTVLMNCWKASLQSAWRIVQHLHDVLIWLETRRVKKDLKHYTFLYSQQHSNATWLRKCVEKEKDVAPDYIHSGFFSNQVGKTTQQMERNSNVCIANFLHFSWNYRQFPVTMAGEGKRVCEWNNPNWKQWCCETKVVKQSTV